MRLHDYLEYRAREQGDVDFAVLGDQRLSYADADAAASRVARALVAAGLAKGDRLALLSKNSIEYAVLYYGCSKAGLLGMTRLLARDLGPYGITVNAIAPGTALTPRVKKVRDEESLKQIAERNPMRHLIDPQDVAEAALYLGSEDGRYVTGVTLPVNAGNLIF